MTSSPEPSAHGFFRSCAALMPRLGAAGSRFSRLHLETSLDDDELTDHKHMGVEAHQFPEYVEWDSVSRRRLHIATLVGTIGSVLLAVGGLGAGAFPVIGNPYWEIPLVGILARMLHTTTVMCFVGIALLVLGWFLLARFTLPRRHRVMLYLPPRTLWRIFVCWTFPILFTAPMFTQDIYSYLAQGSITAQGIDPYSGGPVDLLGVHNELARSVPLMWSHSPSPYGPVAMTYGAVISLVTNDSIVLGILCHRVVSIAGLWMSAWALSRLARRCGVAPQTALWVGVLNPLAILHLVGGIHNESAMMGLLLMGFELVLTGLQDQDRSSRRRALVLAGFILMSMAGLVKVTAFVALGFAGVAVALWRGGRIIDLLRAAVFAAVVAALTSITLSLVTGTGFGWITSQGGAAEIVSWMSLTTLTGLASNILAMYLGLGDHLNASLFLFRALGAGVAAVWLARMLWAAFKSRIHPLGAFGVSTLVMIFFFPVVQPWYLLWAIMPLAAWANRRAFQQATVLYSTAFSFAILPRGLGLPPLTVVYIYAMSVFVLAVLLGVFWLIARSHPELRQALASTRIQHLQRVREAQGQAKQQQ
ncbi:MULTISPECIES: polyprenol phosphomannose-dependent alpha 1,6 mannosyltransferase MptB [Corynebacterium]|uniref:polyprenol phosphomannose-dependent alpha 1,6 mannosyltransferase MptB n=1 Tax=Corynebacterium TaxID=1716 RepID=UPI001658DE17|nr:MULTISPECIES: polyprenol phosphomannose-dependent alpha 1,6 mannosyltransferase MptB [Corynebacterium]QNP93025.1 polyprenol phosphomannose-dependent alpha 1,6 mannosyltransferase MptB [Corynebacterium zhongnanshanii]